MKYLIIFSIIIAACNPELNNDKTFSKLSESSLSHDSIVPMLFERKLTMKEKIGEPQSVSRPINLNIEFDDKKNKRIEEIIFLLKDGVIDKREYLDYLTNENTYLLKWSNEEIFFFIDRNSKNLRSTYQTSLCIENDLCLDILDIRNNKIQSNQLAMNLSLSNKTNNRILLKQVIIRLNLSPYYIIAKYGFKNFKTKYCEPHSVVTNNIVISSDLFFKSVIIPYIHNDILLTPFEFIEPEIVDFEFELIK